MRHHIDLIARDLEDLLQKLGRELAHNNEPVGKLRDLFQHQHLVRIWLAQNRVQRGDDGHFQTAQQMQDMTAGWTAEYAILVLQRYHVNVVEVQGWRRNLEQSLPAEVQRKQERILVLHHKFQNVSPSFGFVSVLEAHPGA